MALGSVEGFLSRIRRAIRMAAARPCDANGLLIKDSLPIYLKYRSTCDVFHLPVFNSPAFLSLVKCMQEVQEVPELQTSEPNDDNSARLLSIETKVDVLMTLQTQSSSILQQNKQTLQADWKQFNCMEFQRVQCIWSVQKTLNFFHFFQSDMS